MMSKQKVTFKDKKYTIMGLIQFGVETVHVGGREKALEKRHPSFAQRVRGPSVPELEPTSLLRCPPALRLHCPSNTQCNC